MQKRAGNALTSSIVEQQEDDEMSKGLALPVKEKKADKSQVLEQLHPRRDVVQKDEYPKKLGEMVLPAGVVHVGYDQKEKQVILVTVLLHSYRKIVYNNRPVEISVGSQVGIAQDWQRGAVAIKDKLGKSMDKILNTTQKIMNMESESGNLQKVMPFLDDKKEKTAIKQIQNTLANVDNVTIVKDNVQTNFLKSQLHSAINKKNNVLEKKKTKKREIISKLENTLKPIKVSPEKSHEDDLFQLLWQRRRKRIFEEDVTERDEDDN